MLFKYKFYDRMVMSFDERHYLNGLLVKGFNTQDSQSWIHGFETHTGHHLEMNRFVRFNIKKYDNISTGFV